ncbi:hypothetical protein RB195_004320 [Necator americanus]|uniref:Uncharacterized protein n=1 Tax=Necator americanus TaxID=51031 RepID=A0ABR1BHE8_NECAM
MVFLCFLFPLFLSIIARPYDITSCAPFDGPASPSPLVQSFNTPFTFLATVPSNPFQWMSAPIWYPMISSYPVISAQTVTPYQTWTSAYSYAWPKYPAIPRIEVRNVARSVTRETSHFSSTSRRYTGIPVKRLQKNLEKRKNVHRKTTV